MRDGQQVASTHRRRRTPLRSALALFALGILTFVVEPHIDGRGGVAVSPGSTHTESGAGGEAILASPIQAPESVCLICQALATAGVTLLPHAAALVVDARAAGADLAPAVDAPTSRYAGRIWRSRAPPLRS